VERTPKRELLDFLKQATRRTVKGEYHKTRCARNILRSIDPEKVKATAPNCKRLFDVMVARLSD
jgi:hypothetical protein